jgi:flagellum-specific peptidoglycan hydrolase FlgJ
MGLSNETFIHNAVSQAASSGHIFPEMAACEAALESAKQGIFGGSSLALRYNNLFGTKQHAVPVFSTVYLPTQEEVTPEESKKLKNAVFVAASRNGKNIYTYDAPWIVYPDWAAAFGDRMATLRRLQNTYPHYKAALNATDPITFVNQVSLTWSTGQNRADSVIKIYHQYIK